MADATFYLPDLGEGLVEAKVIGWRVAPGDHVVKDQPIVEVETTKAAVEIPSGFAGRIVALRAAVGDVVPVGQALFDYAADAEPGAGGIVGVVPKKSERTRRVHLRPPKD
ncbi:MAG TPA: biotin/lipoyl-containing protein [Rhodanobacteraceae bacterium]